MFFDTSTHTNIAYQGCNPYIGPTLVKKMLDFECSSHPWLSWPLFLYRTDYAIKHMHNNNKMTRAFWMKNCG
jgi:hypothetical protein